MSFTAQGLLGGGFVFAGVTVDNFEADFEWSNGQALITGGVPDSLFVAAAAGFPGSTGSFGVSLQCLTPSCVADFTNGRPGLDSHGFMFVDTPVPEPPTAALLGVVLLTGVFIRGTRILLTV